MKISVKGHQEARKQRFYYGGSTAELQPGFVFCYKHDAPIGLENTSRFAAVAKPATANLNLFAGILAEKPGPEDQYVTLYVPEKGKACKALTKANMTVGTTALAPVNGEWHLVAHADSGLNLPVAALAGETADTSTTAANALVYLR